MPDLRFTLTQHSAESHADWQVVLTERNGARRLIRWLTIADATARIRTLSARGYSVALESMFPGETFPARKES